MGNLLPYLICLFIGCFEWVCYGKPGNPIQNTYDLIQTTLIQFPNKKNDIGYAELMGAKLANHFRNHGSLSGLQEPLAIYDRIRNSFQSLARITFENAFRRSFLSSRTSHSPCAMACQIAGNTSLWAQQEYLDPASEGRSTLNRSGWHYALLSLSGLFLSKAAPYCPKLGLSLSRLSEVIAQRREVPAIGNWANDHQNLSERLTHAGINPGNIQRVLDFLGDTADAETPATRPIENALGSYGNMFHALFLDSQRSNSGAGSELSNATSRIHANLSHFEQNMDPDSRAVDSVWHTYALSVAAITVSNSQSPHYQRAISRLRQTRNRVGNACLFPYYPDRGLVDDPTSGDRAAMAPRSVTANLALYLDRGVPEKSRKETANDREALLESIGCFHEFGWRSALQIFSTSYHSSLSEYGGIGNHYLYSNLPYIVLAIQRLTQDPNLSFEARMRLQRYDRGIRELVLSLFDDSLLVRQTGGNNPLSQSARFYIQPLAGLALLQYCAPQGVSLSLASPDTHLTRLRNEQQNTPPSERSFPPTRRMDRETHH